MSVTDDRQTDDRQTDGMATANSERERELTFPNKIKPVINFRPKSPVRRPRGQNSIYCT